ncbi:MAG: hypothetical protein GF346_08455 [Candidatus Eisenbacteria bacterium]|nr:hypothetical protein [Candidatus Latescibacterota bacterium]MBD3302465.1 hypothetical protein [Candidatus Eisenbacteria bacterium]
MVPIRILVVGAAIPLLRQIHDLLDREGFLVTVASPGPAPSRLLSRHLPDLLVLDAEPRLGRWNSWRRAIRACRSRRPLSVLLVTETDLDSAARQPLLETADLGILPRPIDPEQLVARVVAWYHRQIPIPRVAAEGKG